MVKTHGVLAMCTAVNRRECISHAYRANTFEVTKHLRNPDSKGLIPLVIAFFILNKSIIKDAYYFKVPK